MVRIQKILDRFLGSIIIIFLYLFTSFGKNPSEKKKFLVIKLWAIGDAVISLPLIRGIRESFPGAEVDVLLRDKVRDVFECYPVERIYSLDFLSDIFSLLIKGRQYDVVIDCEPYLNLSAIVAFLIGKERIGFANQRRSDLYTRTSAFRKDQHMVQNYLDLLRKLDVSFNVDKLEKLIVAEDLKGNVDGFLAEKKKRKLTVGITAGVGASSKNRMWYEDRFAVLADRIMVEFNADVIFIDSKENLNVNNCIISMMKEKPINSIGIFTLKETIYLIGRCDLFISNDTGPMHIAAAQGCKTIGLFGPNSPVLWAPYGHGNAFIYKTKLPPAIENDKGITREGNREGYMGCIEVEDVFDKVQEMIGS